MKNFNVRKIFLCPFPIFIHVRPYTNIIIDTNIQHVKQNLLVKQIT